jgi:hypothetical protein
MDRTLTRRTALGVGLAAATLPLVPQRANAAAAAPVLLELFTSQGCSSCPPADKLLGEFAIRKDLIVLSLNVDYWDYLGWRDTLASKDFTKRQMDYAHARGDGEVYTPQLVINGASHAVGSRRSDVEAAINAAQPADVRLALDATRDEITIDIAESETPFNGTLWLLSVSKEVSVEIERGENTGKTITYHNVVRKLTPAGMYKGIATTLAMPRKSITGQCCTHCVAVLQEGTAGRVRGIQRFKFDTPV